MMKRFRYMLANLITGGDFFFITMQFEKRHETWRRMTDNNARALELIERMEGVIAGLQNDVIVKQNTVVMWEYRWNELDEGWTQRVKVLCGAIETQAAHIDKLNVTPIGKLHNSLQQIIACDTPNSNGTVKRMVRIAREALK